MPFVVLLESQKRGGSGSGRMPRIRDCYTSYCCCAGHPDGSRGPSIRYTVTSFPARSTGTASGSPPVQLASIGAAVGPRLGGQETGATIRLRGGSSGANLALRKG